MLYMPPTPAPLSNPSNCSSLEVETPSLPKDVTIEQVYADMIKYLMDNTKSFFEETTPNGADIWARVRDTIVIVLATPNAWGILERTILRKAAIMASVVTEESAGQLLRFVTEAEASVHYALAQDLEIRLKEHTVFAVVDCGDSTVDTTFYRCISTAPVRLTETHLGECIQAVKSLYSPISALVLTFHKAGSIFVKGEVKNILERKLRGTSFSDPEIIESMVDAFEREVGSPLRVIGSSFDQAQQCGPKFDGTMEKYALKFGVNRDNYPSLGISRGRITLSNEELKPVFDMVIGRIVKSCSGAIVSQKPEVT
jgi:hypothetical protein